MQFPHESRLMYYATSPHVLCSCSKCFPRNYPADFENPLHLLHRQELEARERYMYSPHGLSLQSPGGIPSTFGHPMEARHYYPASTLATQLPTYPYNRDANEYGKINLLEINYLKNTAEKFHGLVKCRSAVSTFPHMP